MIFLYPRFKFIGSVCPDKHTRWSRWKTFSRMNGNHVPFIHTGAYGNAVVIPLLAGLNYAEPHKMKSSLNGGGFPLGKIFEHFIQLTFDP